MRFLDIGVAVMVGVSAIMGVVVWTPRNGDAVSSRMVAQAHLRDQLLSFLEDKGLPWLLRATTAELCSELASAVAGASGVFLQDGAESCGSPPPSGAVSSNLTLRLLHSEVNLVAWSGAPG